MVSITPFDLGGSAAKGQELGRQDRLRESNNALTGLLQQTPPTTPENRQALTQQAFTSGIDPQQSFQLVQGLAQMDAAGRAQLKEKTAQAARLAFTIKGLPAEQRGPAFLQARQQMPDVFDQNVTDQQSLDFALDSTINEGLTLSDLFKQAEGFTLKPGEERFSGQGDVIASRSSETPPPKATDVAGLRKEFSAESKDFRAAQSGLLKVNQAAAGGGPQDDIALIFGFMKVIDPQSTVREGEFATAQQTEGVPGQITNLYNRIISGERLNPDQRQGFVDAARRQFTPIKREQDKRTQDFRDIALRSGFDPRNVVRDLVLPEPASPQQAAPTAAAPSAPAVAKTFDQMTAEELGAVDIDKVPADQQDDLRRAFERVLSDG